MTEQTDGKRYGVHVSKDHYPYPEDEFDVLGQGRTPVGVHREPVPRWRQWLPYLLVLVLVPLLTFGVVKFFAKDITPEPTATDVVDEQTTGEDGEGDDDAGGDAGDEPDAEPEDETDDDVDDDDAGDNLNPDDDEDTDEEDLNHDTHIMVLNGARIQGFAGEVAEALAAEGWTSTEPDNYNNESPTETTLYYSSEEFAQEAEAVAEQLGIGNVVESADAASNGIVVVLRPDFSLPG